DERPLAVDLAARSAEARHALRRHRRDEAVAVHAGARVPVEAVVRAARLGGRQRHAELRRVREPLREAVRVRAARVDPRVELAELDATDRSLEFGETRVRAEALVE